MSNLKIVFWDVQHGSAAFIETPNGTHIVQDLGTGSTGSFKQAFSPLLHLQNKYQITQLDYVIITHPHKDHIDDILHFDDLEPRVLSRPKHLSREDIGSGIREQDKPLFDKYFEINDRYSSPVDTNESPKTPKNNGGVSIQTFTPSKCPTSNLNNHSLVTVMEYATCKILLPGDNEAPSWRELLERNDFKESIRNTDILLASHHGREAGFCEDIFEYFKPKLTIISDGPDGGTSAIDRYRAQSSGWVVHKRSGGQETRYCVTTRRDGVVVVKFGYNDKDPFIEVTID